VKSEKWKVESGISPPYGEAVTEVYVHAFQRVAGVKGAAPLVALRRERNPLKLQICICKAKGSKVKNPKAQFRSNKKSQKLRFYKNDVKL
jgi:hypothetical protein